MASEKEMQVAIARLQKLKKLRATLRVEIDNLDSKLDHYLENKFLPQAKEENSSQSGEITNTKTF